MVSLRPEYAISPTCGRRLNGGSFAIVVIVAALWITPVRAYEPPVDSAGPLTARIEGPEQVTETGVPVDVGVVLENGADRRLEGTVRIGLIDDWQAEPSGNVPFAVEAGGTLRLDFMVTAPERTYNAHYPIHAFVEFASDGRTLRAHPILIVETKLQLEPHAPDAIEFKPVEVPACGELALWQLPVHRSVVSVFDEKPVAMPVGWRGSAPVNRASLSIGPETLDGDTRQCITIHPPWAEGQVGSLQVEFPLDLPDSTPITLRFASAVTPDGQGDGVTFKVTAFSPDIPEGAMPGRVLFERHVDAHTWQPVEVDLSDLAGRSVRLQLESHPGPRNNTGWDRSFWAEPTLVTGTPPEPGPFPPEDDTGARRLGSIGGGAVQYEVLLWPGSRGLLDSVVGFRAGDRQLHFRGFEVTVLGSRLDDRRSAILLVRAEQEPCDDGYQVRHHFSSHLGNFDLVGRLSVDGPALRARFHLENAPAPRPWQVVRIEGVATGRFSDSVRQVYAGAGNVVREPGPFRLNFDGHRLSTSFVGFDFANGMSMVEGVDVPPDALEVDPSRRHYSLHTPEAATWAFIPAENVWHGVKQWRDVNGLAAAPGVKKVAGRFVFDLWGGQYGQSASQLRRAFRYGLTDSMVVWHNWQRWGYDYRLPEIYPPNPKMGTFDEMQTLIETCRAAGVPIALHDNYIDFYPDADGFSYQDRIAFRQDGSPVKAWLNEHRGARSYRYRADAVEPYLRQNLRTIHEHLNPTAYFIDVWSSARPYEYWTADGEFFDRLYTRDSWGDHFAWIRDLFGDDAPQISESGHDQLIGRLDGAQTNHLRVGEPSEGRWGWCVWDWPCGDAERTCWFDAAHHDRFILHGAGYGSRYVGGLDQRTHGMYSDDYMSTEVLTGHPAMVHIPFGRDVVRKYWLTADLMRALALRTIEMVDYAGDDLHRQHVSWSGGAEVWVNRGSHDWTVAGTTLAEFGFKATVPTESGPVEASICRIDGTAVEIAQSADRLYFNARRAPGEAPIDFGPVATTGACRLTREGNTLTVTPLPDSAASFQIAIRWTALPWRLPEAAHVEAIDEESGVLARHPIHGEDGRVVLDCEPGVFAYRVSL